MADDYTFELNGLQEMSDKLTMFEKMFFKNLDNILSELAEKVILDARRLAPVLSGDLEASLDFDEVKTSLSMMYIDFGVVSSPEVQGYAWAQHEGFRKVKKTGKVIMFTPGESTGSKGPYKGFSPGKKYLQNAITINEDLVLNKLAEAMNFGGGL